MNATRGVAATTRHVQSGGAAQAQLWAKLPALGKALTAVRYRRVTQPAGQEGAHAGDAGQVVGGRIAHQPREHADALERVTYHFDWSAATVASDLTHARDVAVR